MMCTTTMLLLSKFSNLETKGPEKVPIGQLLATGSSQCKFFQMI